MASILHCDGCDVQQSEKYPVYNVSFDIDRSGKLQQAILSELTEKEFSADLCDACIKQVKHLMGIYKETEATEATA